eukprot:COSAG01_NODE_61422_length_289_cov_1.657895_1_plen_34_part_10
MSTLHGGVTPHTPHSVSGIYCAGCFMGVNLSMTT